MPRLLIYSFLDKHVNQLHGRNLCSLYFKVEHVYLQKRGISAGVIIIRGFSKEAFSPLNWNFFAMLAYIKRFILNSFFDRIIFGVRLPNNLYVLLAVHIIIWRIHMRFCGGRLRLRRWFVFRVVQVQQVYRSLHFHFENVYWI